MTGAVRHRLPYRFNDCIVVSPEGKTFITRDYYHTRDAVYQRCELYDLATARSLKVLSDDCSLLCDVDGATWGDPVSFMAFGSENMVILASRREWSIVNLATEERRKFFTGGFLVWVIH